MPLSVGGECSKVTILELGNKLLIELCMLCHCKGLAVIVSSMTEDLCHVSIRMLSIEWLLSNFTIALNVAGPGKLLSPCKPTYRSVEVSGFASVKVTPVFEEVPFDCSDETRFSLFKVDVGELVSVVCDEDASESLLDILKIPSSAEVAKARTKSTCRCSRDVIRCAHPSVAVNFSLKNPDLFSDVSKGENVADDWLGVEVDIEALQCIAIDCRGVDALRVPLFDGGQGEDGVE